MQLRKLLEFLNDSAGGARIVLVEHGEMDALMLKSCLGRLGIAPGPLLTAIVMDTLHLAKETVRRANVDQKDLKLCSLFKDATRGQDLGDAHQAMVDAGGAVAVEAWLWDNLGKPSLSRFVDLYGAFVYAACERNAVRALARDAGAASATVPPLTSREATPNAGAGGYFGTGAGGAVATARRRRGDRLARAAATRRHRRATWRRATDARCRRSRGGRRRRGASRLLTEAERRGPGLAMGCAATARACPSSSYWTRSGSTERPCRGGAFATEGARADTCGAGDPRDGSVEADPGLF